jgi:hypothetical protein
MSARNYGSESLSNNRRNVNYNFSLTSLAGAAAAPTFIEGDGFTNLNVPANVSIGTYMTVTRTGVGVYVIKTLDPFTGFIACGFQIAATTPAGQLTVNVTPATQNADNSWSVTLSCFNGAAARELALGDYIYGWICFRNGTNTP